MERSLLFGGMLAVAVGHLVLVLTWAGRGPGRAVSDLEVPTVVAGLDRLPAVEAGSGPGGTCRVLVAFEPTCPACGEAAESHGRRTGPASLPVTWIARDQAAAERFRREHPGLQLVVDPGLRDALGVRRVPAAFLVAGDTVLRSWHYRGSEDLSVLREGCPAPAAPPLQKATRPVPATADPDGA